MAVAAALAFAFPVFSNAYWQRVFASGQYFFEAPNAILSGRLQSWEFLGDFLASHPWHMLAGVGYKTDDEAKNANMVPPVQRPHGCVASRRNR